MERAFAALVLLVAALAAGCERAPSSPSPGASVAATPKQASAGAASGKVAARHGSETLTADELAEELKRLPDRSRRMMNAEARARFVDNYVVNALLYEEGERRGFAQDPEIVRQVDDLRRRLVVQKVVRDLQNVPPVTDEEIKAYYDANPDKFSTTTIRARHILVKDEAKAKDLLAQVKADPSKFADVAQANSVDAASARKGGDLGFFGHGRMVPEFETAAFALQAGEISDVVKTPYGYHIIKVEEVRAGTQKPFEQVKEQIRATLRGQALQTRTRDYYDDLKKRANVTVDQTVIEEVATQLPAPPEDAEPAPAHGHAGLAPRPGTASAGEAPAPPPQPVNPHAGH